MPTYETIRDNDIKSFNQLRGNADALVYRGLTATQVAARYNRFTILRALINDGADIDLSVNVPRLSELRRQEAAQSALAVAQTRGHVKFASFLRCCGATTDEKADSEEINLADLKAALITAVCNGDVGVLQRIQATLEVTTTIADKILTLAQANPKQILIAGVQETLHHLLDLAAANNNSEVFKQLLSMGAKLTHGHHRRSAYYWAYKFNNQKILALIKNEFQQRRLSGEELSSLQLNALYFLGEDKRYAKRKTLFGMLKDYNSKLKDDLTAYKHVAQAVHHDKPSANIVITVGNANPVKPLTAKNKEYYDAAQQDVFSIKEELVEPDSFYRVLVHALAIQDYVVFNQLLPFALNNTKLIDEILDDDNTELLTLLLFAGAEPLTYAQHLIDSAVTALTKAPKAVPPVVAATTPMAIEMTMITSAGPSKTDHKSDSKRDEDDKSQTSSVSTAVDAKNSKENKIKIQTANRLEKFLHMGWSLDGLLQNIFAGTNKKLFRDLIYLLAIQQRSSASKFDKLVQLLAILPHNIQLAITKQFLLVVQDERDVDLTWMLESSDKLDVGQRFRHYLTNCKTVTASVQQHVWRCLNSRAQLLGIELGDAIIHKATLGEDLLSSAYKFVTPTKRQFLWDAKDIAKLSSVSSTLYRQFGTNSALVDKVGQKRMRALMVNQEALTLIAACIQTIDTERGTMNNRNRRKCISINGIFGLGFLALSVYLALSAGEDVNDRSNQVDLAYNNFSQAAYQNSTCGNQFPWVLADSRMTLETFPTCSSGDMKIYTGRGDDQPIPPDVQQTFNSLTNSLCGVLAVALCSALNVGSNATIDGLFAVFAGIAGLVLVGVVIGYFRNCCRPRDAFLSNFFSDLAQDVQTNLTSLNNNNAAQIPIDRATTIQQIYNRLLGFQQELRDEREELLGADATLAPVSTSNLSTTNYVKIDVAAVNNTPQPTTDIKHSDNTNTGALGLSTDMAAQAAADDLKEPLLPAAGSAPVCNM